MNVTVYSTPTCGWCKKIKTFLDDHHVEYDEIDVSADQKKAQEMIDKTGQMGVPVTEIDGDILIGYDEEKLKELLKI